MKSFFYVKNFGLMLLLCLFFYHAKAQEKFKKTDAQLIEIKKLKIAVEANPSNLKAHEAFINAFDVDEPAILDVYQNWEKRFPKEYVVPFTIGRALQDREDLNARGFLLNASVLKPDNGKE